MQCLVNCLNGEGNDRDETCISEPVGQRGALLPKTLILEEVRARQCDMCVDGYL